MRSLVSLRRVGRSLRQCMRQLISLGDVVRAKCNACQDLERAEAAKEAATQGKAEDPIGRERR